MLRVQAEHFTKKHWMVYANFANVMQYILQYLTSMKDLIRYEY